jgi:hypothetical protein
MLIAHATANVQVTAGCSRKNQRPCLCSCHANTPSTTNTRYASSESRPWRAKPSFISGGYASPALATCALRFAMYITFTHASNNATVRKIPMLNGRRIQFVRMT